MNPFFSIIIPVHNTEKYLPKCLDSILAQTCQEFEVICIDDCSTDNSLQVLNAYASKDSRIKPPLSMPSKRGGGAARNLGLAHAKGSYLVFLDSDDFFEDTLLEDIKSVTLSEDVDVVLFNARQLIEETGEYKNVNHYLRSSLLRDRKDKVLSVSMIPDDIFYISNPSPWTKAFRRDFIYEEKITFQELANTNDLFFSYAALALAKSISWVDKRLVTYRVRDYANTQSKLGEAPDCFVRAYEQLFALLRERGLFDLLRRSFLRAMLSTAVYCLGAIPRERPRDNAIHALKASMMLEAGLLELPDEYYLNLDDRDRILAYIKGSEWRDRHERIHSLPDTYHVVSKARINSASVSVVIPIYNVENYIEECLNSVRQQTLNDIEIICVIDGSTDASSEIVRRHAKSDDRIVVIEQENQGLSAARNHGLREAVGTYVYFIDGDDILKETALSELVRACDEHALDSVYFDADCFSSGGYAALNNSEINKYHREHSYPMCCSGISLLEAMRENREFYPSACLQLNRRTHLLEHDLSFHRGIVHEDYAFTLLSMAYAHRSGYVAKPFYGRRVRPNSITTEPESFDNAYGYWVAHQDVDARIPSFSGMSESEQACLHEAALQILTNARDVHARLSTDERLVYLSLSPIECYSFKKDVAAPAEWKRGLVERQKKLQVTYDEKRERGIEIERLKREEASLRNEAERLRAENDEILRKYGWVKYVNPASYYRYLRNKLIKPRS